MLKKSFEEKFADFLKTVFEEGKLKDENSFKAISKVAKMLFVESAIEEAMEKILPEADVSVSPDMALGLFTVITSHNKPVGYLVDFSLTRELNRSSDFSVVLTVLDTLALEVYKASVCKEDD